MFLGDIFSVYFDKNCQTTWLFDKFKGWGTDKKYDTLCLKNVFSIWKHKPCGTVFDDIVAGVSFYIQDSYNDYQNIIKDNRTISKLKHKFCDTIFGSDTQSSDIILSTISKAFDNELFDKNGDFLFDTPISFKAQGTYDRNSLGFGRTTEFYIIGVNFNGEKFQKHLKEIENQDNKKLNKNLAANQMKQIGFPPKDITDFVEHNIVYLYNDKKVVINEETEPELSSYLHSGVYAVIPEKNSDIFLILYAYENNDNLIEKVFVKNIGNIYFVEAGGWCRDGRHDGTIAGIMTNSTKVESISYEEVRELAKQIKR